MPAKLSWILIGLLCAAVFSWSLYRDIQAEKQYAGDLRNRVVGARMQKDGLSPYFYKWKKGDGFRYYDPNNFDSLKASNITASPFFHHLLYPLAEFSQRTISVCWLVIEYSMLMLCIVLALLLAVTTLQQRLVLFTAALFLFTEAWKMHVANGQNYLCVSLLAMAFYYCISKKKSLATAFIAGSIAVTLVLIKPNAVLFFFPFLFLVKKISRNYLVVLMLPFIIAGLWIISSSTEMYFWKQYQENISQQIKIHQQESPQIQVNQPSPAFTLWEGISSEEIMRNSIAHPMHIYSENGNVFVLARLVLHQRLRVSVLFVISSLVMLLLLIIFYARHRLAGFTMPSVAFIAFALYMVSDLFSPVYRHQYYGVQWLFPLLLSAAVYDGTNKKIYLALISGIVLNIVNIGFVPMEHTIGEYIMLLAFIVLSLRREDVTIQ